VYCKVETQEGIGLSLKDFEGKGIFEKVDGKLILEMEIDPRADLVTEEDLLEGVGDALETVPDSLLMVGRVNGASFVLEALSEGLEKDGFADLSKDNAADDLSDGDSLLIDEDLLTEAVSEIKGLEMEGFEDDDLASESDGLMDDETFLADAVVEASRTNEPLDLDFNSRESENDGLADSFLRDETLVIEADAFLLVDAVGEAPSSSEILDLESDGFETENDGLADFLAEADLTTTSEADFLKDVALELPVSLLEKP